MKQKVTLGTNGTQPFKVSGSYVSRHHAEIVIDDSDVWTLNDLDSTNGTYIRDENTGEMMRISSVLITPMTFICLGSETPLGCCFYAKQAIKHGDYREELRYMKNKEQALAEEEEKLQKKNKLANVLVRLALLLIIAVVALAAGSSFIIPQSMSPAMNIITMILMASAVSIVPFFFDVNKKKKRLNSKREHFRQCPNPECSHILSAKEMLNMYCSKCRCH